jgi:SNF2 family DNA or RNA helicase
MVGVMEKKGVSAMLASNEVLPIAWEGQSWELTPEEEWLIAPVANLPLFSYQRKALAWSLSLRKSGRLGALLAFEMGLGKTPTALAHIAAVGGSALVIVPNSLVTNWLEESRRWAPCIPPLASRKPGEIRDGNIVIQPISVYRKRSLQFEVQKSDQPLTIVVDESHSLKDPSSLQSRKIRELIRAARQSRPTFVLLLTGTPWTTSAGDLWAQIDAIGELYPTESFRSWLKRFAFRKEVPTPLGWVEKFVGVKDVSNLAKRISPFTLRAERSKIFPNLTKLPPAKVVVEVSQGLRQAIDEEIARLSEIDDSELEISSFAKLRRLVGMAKVEPAISWVKDFMTTGRQLVIFTWHREVASKIAEATGAGLISGDVGQEDRNLTIKEFQEGDLQVLVLTIATGGLGINLQCASDALFVEHAWTPALMKQAEDRLVRIGQKSPVAFTWLVADHKIDRVLVNVLEKRAKDDRKFWNEIEIARQLIKEVSNA